MENNNIDKYELACYLYQNFNSEMNRPINDESDSFSRLKAENARIMRELNENKYLKLKDIFIELKKIHEFNKENGNIKSEDEQALLQSFYLTYGKPYEISKNEYLEGKRKTL